MRILVTTARYQHLLGLLSGLINTPKLVYWRGNIPIRLQLLDLVLHHRSLTRSRGSFQVRLRLYPRPTPKSRRPRDILLTWEFNSMWLKVLTKPYRLRPPHKCTPAFPRRQSPRPKRSTCRGRRRPSCSLPPSPDMSRRARVHMPSLARVLKKVRMAICLRSIATCLHRWRRTHRDGWARKAINVRIEHCKCGCLQ